MAAVVIVVMEVIVTVVTSFKLNLWKPLSDYLLIFDILVSYCFRMRVGPE